MLPHTNMPSAPASGRNPSWWGNMFAGNRNSQEHDGEVAPHQSVAMTEQPTQQQEIIADADATVEDGQVRRFLWVVKECADFGNQMEQFTLVV